MLMLTLPAAALLVAADDVRVDTLRLPSDGGEGDASRSKNFLIAGSSFSTQSTNVVP